MCVGRVSWGHSLAVGVQLAVSIGLAMKSYCYLLVSVKGTIHDQSTGYLDKIVAKLLNYQLHQISYPPQPHPHKNPHPCPCRPGIRPSHGELRHFVLCGRQISLPQITLPKRKLLW